MLDFFVFIEGRGLRKDINYLEGKLLFCFVFSLYFFLGCFVFGEGIKKRDFVFFYSNFKFINNSSIFFKMLKIFCDLRE